MLDRGLTASETAPYAVTIGLGAFLLFLVQPLIGKYILPWFGGSPGVWTTCLLFFQVLLLAGYAYAHLLTSRLAPRMQPVVHILLLLVALACLPITPNAAWKPQGSVNPTWHILALLTTSVGVPYLVLAATSPLLQHWLTRLSSTGSPYRLYALSNAGSLLALLGFPFVFEPQFTRQALALLWGGAFVIYVLACAACALKLRRNVSHSPLAEEPSASPTGATTEAIPLPSLTQRALWVLLPACASILLLAITNKLCQDVAVIPFLWVLPLSLYLLSFIICFDSPRWYVRPLFALLLVAGLAAVCLALHQGTSWPIRWQITVYCLGLFIACMACHGELFRLKPSPHYLTSYYLLVAAGGALGGLFVAVLAPLLFTDYFELHWGLFACAVCFTLACARDRDPINLSHWRILACALPLAAWVALDRVLGALTPNAVALPRNASLVLRGALWTGGFVLTGSWLLRGQFRRFQHWHLLGCLWLGLSSLALGTVLRLQAVAPSPDRVSRTRTFYGVLTVYEHDRDDPQKHDIVLQHGRITHGLQFVDALRAGLPTTYYGEESGVGLAFGALPVSQRRVGLVGLGAGTLTVYARPGDYFRIYEINPEVSRLARAEFGFLNQCAGQVDVVLGDARLSLEQEPPQNFDLLALDAFSGDAIPVHLLTREAFALYERHLNPNGIIAVHISNHYLNLQPVVQNLAREFNYQVALIDYDETDEEWWLYASTWMLLTRNPAVLNLPSIRDAATPLTAPPPSLPTWTDDFASLLQVLR
jgi:hypothetical protein